MTKAGRLILFPLVCSLLEASWTSSSPPPRYTFNYGVRDPRVGMEFGHGERRDGDSTRGVYFNLLPDGRRQTVEYTVDKETGFQARVTYEDTNDSSLSYEAPSTVPVAKYQAIQQKSQVLERLPLENRLRNTKVVLATPRTFELPKTQQWDFNTDLDNGNGLRSRSFKEQEEKKSMTHLNFPLLSLPFLTKNDHSDKDSTNNEDSRRQSLKRAAPRKVILRRINKGHFPPTY